MKTVSDIQDGMRFKGAEDSITITEGEGLRNFNNVYRAMAAALPWSELTREDTSTSTTTAARYDWPESPAFLDVRLVEIQDGDDNDYYKPMWPPSDVTSLSASRRKTKQSVPDFYWRFSTAVKDQVELVPGPKYSGKTVRITGIIEPDELGGPDDRTVFLTRAADDALEYLLAAMYKERDGMFQDASAALSRAQEILQRLFGKELVPDELVRRIVPPP